MLDASQRNELLRVAREALIEHLHTGRSAPVPAEPRMHGAGAFVSLHRLSSRGRELRGCLGTLDDRQPLQEMVARMAVAAATRDPRFSAVTAEELVALEIEISVLSPMRVLTSPENLQLGRHGLLVSRGLRRGLLLPQVALEHDWDREQFLAQACVKAGLGRDAWCDSSTTVEVFTAEVFRDR